MGNRPLGDVFYSIAALHPHEIYFPKRLYAYKVFCSKGNSVGSLKMGRLGQGS